MAVLSIFLILNLPLKENPTATMKLFEKPSVQYRNHFRQQFLLDLLCWVKKMTVFRWEIYIYFNNYSSPKFFWAQISIKASRIYRTTILLCLFWLPAQGEPWVSYLWYKNHYRMRWYSTVYSFTVLDDGKYPEHVCGAYSVISTIVQ